MFGNLLVDTRLSLYRLPGFKISVTSLRGLAAVTGFGLVNLWLNQFADIDIFGMAKSALLAKMSGVKVEL